MYLEYFWVHDNDNLKNVIANPLRFWEEEKNNWWNKNNWNNKPVEMVHLCINFALILILSHNR